MVNEIDTSKLGIVLVDMQPFYLKNIKEKDQRKLIRNQINFLENCANQNLPLLIFEGQGPVYSPRYEGTIPELSQIIKKFEKTRTFEKRLNDGFSNYPLVNAQLKEWEVNSVFLTGINALACVRESAYGAKQLGYEVLTSKDLIGDMSGRKAITLTKKWFKENGKFYRTYEKILKNLKRKKS